jgi:hypothetical protein
MQKKAGGGEGTLAIDAETFWNSSTDGHLLVRYENDYFYAFVTVYGLAL